MAVSFKGAHFPQEIILTGVRWYIAYPLSTRHVEELMRERGVHVDHSTVNRWVIKYSPQLEDAFHRRKRPVGPSWRLDETYIRVKGEWRYLYRAVDKHGQTIDFLLTEHRDQEAALRFLKKAIRRGGVPEKITIDGSDANEAAIKRYNAEYGTHIIIRQENKDPGDQDTGLTRTRWHGHDGGIVPLGNMTCHGVDGAQLSRTNTGATLDLSE